jgi:hypothetical protein
MPYSSSQHLDANMGSYGNMQSPGMFSRALSGVGNFIQQKPELFAMTADQIGQRLNPENPFGGIGTALAKSSLAGKAEDKRMSQQDSIMKFINSLTAPGQPGGNAVTIKTLPDGTKELSYKGALGDGQGLAKPVQTPQNAQAPQTPPGTPPPAQATQAGQAGVDMQSAMSYMEWLQQRALAGGQ